MRKKRKVSTKYSESIWKNLQNCSYPEDFKTLLKALILLSLEIQTLKPEHKNKKQKNEKKASEKQFARLKKIYSHLNFSLLQNQAV